MTGPDNAEEIRSMMKLEEERRRKGRNWLTGHFGWVRRSKGARARFEWLDASCFGTLAEVDFQGTALGSQGEGACGMGTGQVFFLHTIGGHHSIPSMGLVLQLKVR
jgi:hypothetical protein